MREILFRGKLKDGRWAEGNLQIKKDGVCIITPDDTPLGCYGAVFPDTVGQYTGLTDKNDKKIFEGDIVLIPGIGFGVIRYDRACFTLGLVECGFCVSEQSEREILGNIHDNPELLEVRHE